MLLVGGAAKKDKLASTYPTEPCTDRGRCTGLSQVDKRAEQSSEQRGAAEQDRVETSDPFVAVASNSLKCYRANELASCQHKIQDCWQALASSLLRSIFLSPAIAVSGRSRGQGKAQLVLPVLKVKAE